jgi:hypothetical protein
MPPGILEGQTGPSIYLATSTPTRPKPTSQPHTHINTDASASDRQNGTVKWFNDEKGYDFITTENCSLIIHHQYTNHALISNTDASASNRQNSTVK